VFRHAAGRRPGACAVDRARTNRTYGTYYGPHFVANWTTGHAETNILPATSTFYYTLDTYYPYGQVIFHSTIEGPSPPKTPPKPGPPTCKGTKCM
jgi:hypothetical protein